MSLGPENNKDKGPTDLRHRRAILHWPILLLRVKLVNKLIGYEDGSICTLTKFIHLKNKCELSME